MIGRLRQLAIGSLITSLALVCLSSLATQFLAWYFAYHPALGRPWIGHLYAPSSWLEWQARYRHGSPSAFTLLYSGMGVL